MPEVIRRHREEIEQIVIALRGEQRAQAVDRALEETAQRGVGVPGQPAGAEQLIGPVRGKRLRYAQLAPMVTESFEIRDLIVLAGLPQALEPPLPHCLVDRRGGNDSREVRDRLVHGGTDSTRRAVDLFDGRRQPFQEQHRAFGGQYLVFTGDPLDLGHGLKDALDRRLRFPAKGVAAEARAKRPWM